MKKSKKKILIFFMILICATAVVLIINHLSNKDEEEKKSIQMTSVGGLPATCDNNIERDLDISYFRDLPQGTSFQDVIDEIGEPNGYAGSGIVRPYYKVGEHYIVFNVLATEEGWGTIGALWYCTNEEVVEVTELK